MDGERREGQSGRPRPDKRPRGQGGGRPYGGKPGGKPYRGKPGGKLFKFSGVASVDGEVAAEAEFSAYVDWTMEKTA